MSEHFLDWLFGIIIFVVYKYKICLYKWVLILLLSRKMPQTSKNIEDEKTAVPLLEKTKLGVVVPSKGSENGHQTLDIEKQEQNTADAHSLGVKHKTTQVFMLIVLPHN